MSNKEVINSKANQKRESKRYQPLLILGFWLSASAVLAVPPPAGVAPVLIPAGGFAIDGDAVANIAPGTGDWVLGTNAGAGGAVLSVSGVPLNPSSTFHFVDAYNSTADQVFVGGLKWTDNPNGWKYTTGKSSSKTDINNVLMHIAADAQGHTWTILAADRASTSGDSYIDFEFLQNPIVKTNGGAFVSGGPNGGRTVNDLLLSLAFEGGGKIADFLAYRWMPDGSGGFAYVDVTASLPAGRVFVALNSNSIAAPFGAFGQNTYAPNAYVEAALDLTALLGNFDPCLSMGFKTIMVKTKSSPSSTATIEDFIDPIQYSLQIGPGADAGPAQVRCTEGAVTSFPLQGKATPGLQPIVSTSWDVVAGIATIDSSSSLITTARVASASATLRLTVLQANGCTETNNVVLTVASYPVCSITGPSSTCPRSSVQFQAPAAASAYTWSVLGNGTISGPTNSQTVTVLAGSGCGTNFTLSLKVTTGICASSCSMDVQVNDTTPPVVTAPADLVLLTCPADTRTNVTGVATAQDDCGVVGISYADNVTNTCGGSKIIARTWTATDLCGNAGMAVQIITVRDTTPPSLVVPPAVTLQCPANTSTDNTGMATAQDACSGVNVTYSDSISNSCGGASVIRRLWTAMDQCGNATTGIQVITVQDQGRPSLTVPADVVLECPPDSSTNHTGSAVAQDTCSAVTVTFSDVVSNTCGGAEVIRRLWTATDACGNTTNRTQTITVRDTTPPALSLPPNLVLECPANTSTNSTGVATAVDACSSATLSYSDTVTNLCGGTKLIKRTWSAVDQCGNRTNAIQTITVRDSTPPSLIIPADLVLECPATTTTNVTGIASATDGCGTVSISYSDNVSNPCGGTKVIARTWTALDQCGNTTNRIQTITVRDSTPPTLTLPANIILDCPANTTTNNTGVATAADGCGSVTISYSDSISNSCGGAKVISRVWTATDQCGNPRSGVQTITVRDITPPTIVAPGDLVLECPAVTTTNLTGTATATDGCSSVRITYSDSISNACGGTKTISRTWTATDGCGNSVSALQKITIRDITPPSLKLPANLVLQCPGDTRTNVTGVPVVTDGCGSVNLSYSDVVSNSCAATRTVWRLWTAIDQCGNTTNGLQTISVIDSTKPTISCPNISVQCVGDIPPAYTNLPAFVAAGGTANDSCSSSLTFALVSDTGLVGRCPGTVTRVYRLTDACGNSADGIQKITVADTTPPVLACPTSVTVECGASLDPQNTGRATATDNCSTNVGITYADASVPSQYDLKFYVADPDTNTGPYSPTYLELSPASLSCVDSARLTGRALDPLRNAVAFSPNGQLDALTSIGNVPMAFGQIVPYEVVIQGTGGPGPERGTVEFSADWHTYTTSNNRFGYDTNYMVYCAFVDAADPGYIDPNLNARVASYSSTVVNRGTVDEAIRGTFRVSGIDPGDRVVVEIWVVLDSAMPDHTGGTVAATLVSAQTAAVPPVPISIGTQTDSLGNLSKIMPLPSPQAQSPLGSLPTQQPTLPGSTISLINRTWTATDDCGNRSTCVQQITVRDTTPPTLTVPPDALVQCPAIDTSTNATGSAVALDGCDSVNLNYSDSVTNVSATSKVITRTWIATDDSGNSTNRIQKITVLGPTTPSLVTPPDMTLNCPANTSPGSTGTATAANTCGSATVSFADAIVTNCPGTKIINRTWTASDGLNSTSRVQVITVRDITPPGLICPPDVVLAWPSSTSTNITGVATAVDGCSTASLQYADVISNSVTANGSSQITFRTWTATDECGNSTNRTQKITLALGISPAVTTQPGCDTVACGSNLCLTVSATGTGPLSYQWRLNGTNIAGATNSSLTLSCAQYTNAGIYSALISNGAGSTVSSPAIVNVAPVLLSQRSNKMLTLSWSGPFLLQSAPSPVGPYANVQLAVSPYSHDMSTNAQRFFRLASQPVGISMDIMPNRQAVLKLTGPPGNNFVLQGSTDLIHWVSLQTNTAPFSFTDTQAPLHPNQFYRKIFAQ